MGSLVQLANVCLSHVHTSAQTCGRDSMPSLMVANEFGGNLPIICDSVSIVGKLLITTLAVALTC